MRGRRFFSATGVGAVAVLLTLTGCGSESGNEQATDGSSTSPSGTASQTPSGSPSASTSPTAPAEGPACASVWKAGASLPGDYQGCLDEAGQWVEPQVIKCSVGNMIVLAAPNFYGVRGHLIRVAEPTYEKSKQYQQVFLTCTG